MLCRFFGCKRIERCETNENKEKRMLYIGTHMLNFLISLFEY